ncbi:hypothetical protein QTN47_27425 [Danxiaibacter flavus]|uniref:Phage protein n=1 Tax=Danxiaibacter flavus TaxID=3049108 RepID=A0ABV3ZN13_9BACT|nr:hypothetical protein QNM32_27425 [Chitinophagaceae bacterium DXS]
MSVKAKFKCDGIKIDELNEGNKYVTLSVVTHGSEENKSFAKYTPAGQVAINISRETSAYDYFKEGSEYYLTFDEVPQ